MHREQKINYLYSIFIFIQLLLPLRVIMKSTFLKIFYYRVCVSVGKSSCHFFLQQQFMYYHNNKYQHAPILHCAYDPYMICNLIIFKQSQNIVSRPEKVGPHHKIIFLGDIYADKIFSAGQLIAFSFKRIQFLTKMLLCYFHTRSDFFFYLLFNIFKIYGVALFF